MIVAFDYIHARLNGACDTMAMPRSSKECLQMALAIGLQESGFNVRRQYGNGPAASFWQMERGGGIKGVMNHPASRVSAKVLCRARGVGFSQMEIWQAMQDDSLAADELGAGFARLLLLTDPRQLPALDDPGSTELIGPTGAPTYPKGGWGYYRWNWRPGKPHPQTWHGHWARALAYVRSA